MKSRPSALRDFTVDRRTWLLIAVSPRHRRRREPRWPCFCCAPSRLRPTSSTTTASASRWSVRPDQPSRTRLMLFVPVVGGLLVGLMAHYGSDKIRGHGIPEAIEAILLRGARVEPQSRRAQADLGGHRHRIRRSVRRGRPNHHDRRSLRFAGRAVARALRRRTHDAAGGRRRGGHVGNVCRAGRGNSARRRAASLRVASAFAGSRRGRKRHWQARCASGGSAQVRSFPSLCPRTSISSGRS